MKNRMLIAAGALALAASSAWAQTEKKPEAAKPAPAAQPGKAAAPTLKVGDKAPAITVDKWVKGESVAGFEKGKAYVVEFWATWCPPCRESIPHLTELQKKHTDVTFIGVASSERQKDPKNDDRLSVLEKFVQAQGDKMKYAVAYDSKRAMTDAWMRPANQNGIPCAFIVDAGGTIAWIGNPLDDEFPAMVAKHSKVKAEPAKGEKDKAVGS
ncbi:MAG: TlpA family protein disulfide reductase [Phycisphaerae bacterium]|nr:TlpA family protein disulfide reductase [Phycisphaerae bacterium]